MWRLCFCSWNTRGNANERWQIYEVISCDDWTGKKWKKNFSLFLKKKKDKHQTAIQRRVWWKKQQRIVCNFLSPSDSMKPSSRVQSGDKKHGHKVLKISRISITIILPQRSFAFCFSFGKTVRKKGKNLWKICSVHEWKNSCKTTRVLFLLH